ncbi:MAG: hypothetical protein PHT69_01405 [Bacteroidales bacterium]|nr:hypothetical protein [Bacteroidales bacterium]
MKKLLLSLLGIIIFTSVFSHPPKTIRLTYSRADQKLTIEAKHKVSNVEAHFIDEITIFVNGVEREKITLTKQSSLEAALYVYTIGVLNAGDKVKVVANCNKMGKKAQELTIR